MLRILAGKPYAGKLHVRIDEGEKKTRSANEVHTLYRLFSFLYSTVHSSADFACPYSKAKSSFLNNFFHILCCKSKGIHIWSTPLYNCKYSGHNLVSDDVLG